MYSLMGSFLVVILLLLGALFFLKKVYGFKPNKKLNDKQEDFDQNIAKRKHTRNIKHFETSFCTTSAIITVQKCAQRVDLKKFAK